MVNKHTKTPVFNVMNEIKYAIQLRKRPVRVIATTLMLCLLLATLCWLPVVRAASFSEEYPSGENYPLGTLVSIKQTEPVEVELANLNNNQYLTGVVVPKADSLISIENQGSDLSVATSGDVIVFVSDINGDITAGDFVGSSWISGVAMRSSTGAEQRLLGIALQDFNADNNETIEFKDVKTPSGNMATSVGKIAVRLFDRDIGTDYSRQLSGIEQLAQRVAGKNVAYSRALMAIGLFISSAIISGVFLANAIRGSFISLGRNPLASESIFNSLLQVSGVSISLVIVGAFMAYLVLIL